MTPYGEGFNMTLLDGVAAIDLVEVTLMNGGSATSEIETTTAAVSASGGNITWVGSAVTFQSVSVSFDGIRIRVEFAGVPGIFDVGVWSVVSQSPGGNNVEVSNVRTVQASLPGYGRLATVSDTTQDIRYNVLQGTSVVESRVVSRQVTRDNGIKITANTDIVRSGSEVQIDGVSLDILIASNDDQLTTALDLVDPNDTTSVLPAQSYPDGATLTISETFFEFLQDN